MPNGHALLSASSADKWLHCTPSARMEAKFPDTAGESAEEGTLAHELAELKVKLYLDRINKAAYTKRYKKIKENELYNKDMDRHTDDYLEYIKTAEMLYATKPYTEVEAKVNYANYVPEGYGTVDCFMAGGGHLNIIDLKYGKTVRVDCEDNPQLKLYALGVAEKYRLLFGVDKITMHIFQPRMGNISSCSISADELYRWAEEVKNIAAMAYDGVGACQVGEWCDSHFCKARAVCRSYMSRMDDIEPQKDKHPSELSADEIGQYMTLAADIKKWYSILEKYTLGALLSGYDIPGWKIVEGRSNRTFSDIDAAYKHLTDTGINEALLYKRMPITLTDCEKLLGKKDFEEAVGDYVIKPPGKPTVVPESDPRTKYSPAAADFAGIE